MKSMKLFKNRFLLTFLATALLFAVMTSPVSGKSSGEMDVRKSIVHVNVTTVERNYAKPWEIRPDKTYTVTGVVIPGNRIIVIGNDIRKSALLEVTKFSSYKKYSARIRTLDMEVNLASLTVEDPSFFDDLTPIDPGKDPLPGSRVVAMKVSQQFHTYAEMVTVMEYFPASYYGYTHTPLFTIRPDEPFPAGGVLLCEGKLCGFIDYSRNGQKADTIPISVVRAFYEREAGKEYSGFVSGGVFFRTLSDPVYREYLKLDANGPGVLVTRVLPGTSAYGIIRKGDIILSVDNISVDSMGNYDDPRLGRQPMDLIFSMDGERLRNPRQKLMVQIIRDGKTMEVALPLQSYKGLAERIPWLLSGNPDFVVEGGFVFVELSVPYLQQVYGDDWKTNSAEYAHLYRRYKYYNIPDDDRYVIVSQILPYDTNRGLESMMRSRVVAVGNEKVKNLKSFYALIQQNREQGQKILDLSLSDGRTIYIDLENSDVTNKRIRERYGVPADSSFGGVQPNE